jgi:thiamine pyrophosphate-dependent acetolactate synthase large subunit-like protein
MESDDCWVLSTMGQWPMPYRRPLALRVSHPGRQVVALSGDGGLAMLMNNSLAFVELEMMARGLVDFETDLQNPNLAKMAEAVGLLGLTAETPEQVRPMIAAALKHAKLRHRRQGLLRLFRSGRGSHSRARRAGRLSG